MGAGAGAPVDDDTGGAVFTMATPAGGDPGDAVVKRGTLTLLMGGKKKKWTPCTVVLFSSAFGYDNGDGVKRCSDCNAVYSSTDVHSCVYYLQRLIRTIVGDRAFDRA